MLGIGTGPTRPWGTGIAAAAALALLLAACSGEQAAPEQAGAAAAGPEVEAAEDPAPTQQQVEDQLAQMSVDELRAAARQAYAESRLYSPPGSSAFEYYLALRDRVPGDAAASSALTDLLPMTVIATEQSRDREDFDEARRLHGLIARASPEHPALARLASTIGEAEQATAERTAQQLTAEEEAARQRELELERQRLQEQQAAAARQAEQEEAERLAAEQRDAAQRAAQAEREAAERQAAQAQAERERAVADAPAELRPISTPAPRYPARALRNGESGEVLVEFTVERDGTVSNARVVSANPARTFDNEALAAVRKWRFEPAAEPTTTRRLIEFNLNQ